MTKTRTLFEGMLILAALGAAGCGPLLVEADPKSKEGNLSGTSSDCIEGQNTYAPGQTFQRDCNSCVCQNDGTILCTQSDCQQVTTAVCTVNGTGYAAGESFTDVCNNCVCQMDGEVICTQRDCAILCSDGGTSTWTESWVQGPAAPADILWVVDDSCSMAESQATLAAGIGDFIAAANAAGGDFHVGVTTTHDTASYTAPSGSGWPGQQVGHGLLWGTPSVVTASTPTPVAVLASSLRPGTSGTAVEKGLDAALLALTPPNSTGPNAGFLRAGKRLEVIFLSDEDDASTVTPADFVSQLSTLTTGPVTVHAIAGLAMGPCPNSATSVVAAGTRYTGAASLTAGVVRDICDLPSQANALGTQLAEAIFPLQSTWKLSHTLNPQSLPTVTVNGTVMASPADFTFDTATNSVVFTDAATPSPGQLVEVSYTGGCGP